MRWNGSIPTDIVAIARRQLFFHVVRLVAPFNRGASGRLGVAAVVLEGDCVIDHTQTDADIQTKSRFHYGANK